VELIDLEVKGQGRMYLCDGRCLLVTLPAEKTIDLIEMTVYVTELLINCQ